MFLIMCSGDKILTEIKCRQVKPCPLFCTVDANCWCMRVQTRFVHHADDCMSPQEMLEQTSVKITDSDRRYLESLKDREFIKYEDDI